VDEPLTQPWIWNSCDDPALVRRNSSPRRSATRSFMQHKQLLHLLKSQDSVDASCCQAPTCRAEVHTEDLAPSVAGQFVIDDCARVRVLGLYRRLNQQSSLAFLRELRDEFPFPVRKIQVDNGTEFPLAVALTCQELGVRSATSNHDVLSKMASRAESPHQPGRILVAVHRWDVRRRDHSAQEVGASSPP
jgi:hypothetical protein